MGRSSSRFPDRPVRPAAALRPTTAIPEVDRRKARRIAAGVIEIEARLDLHGMTQSAAHGRLIGFLQSAVARGLRTVLVITGKGGGRQASPSGSAWWEVEETGILRRSVPRWLAEPPIRGFVIGCQPASPRHGGDGALYILLKRRKPGDRS
jgi:DNA-nicking Smr family endonuclease